MKNKELDEIIDNQDKIIGLYIDRTLKRINSAYQQLFDAQDIKITTEQWVILMIIDESERPMSQTEIADRGFRNRATITRLLKALETEGLITKERFDNDSKRYKILLTEKGRTFIDEILPAVERLRDLGLRKVDPEDFWIFRDVLDQIYENHQKFSKD